MNEKAFTLIELLVAIGVLTFITGIGITLFTSLTQQYDKASSITNLQAEGNRMMEQMARTVRNSAQADDSGGVLTLTIPEDANNLEYDQNGGCVKVDLRQNSDEIIKTTYNSSGNVCGVCRSGCLLNQTTVAEVATSSFDVTVTDNINSPDEVEVKFDLAAPGSDQSQVASVSFSKTVLTRNY